MKPRQECAALLSVLLALPGCSAPPVDTEFDHAADFSALHTYAWQESDLAEIDTAGLDAPAIDRMIHDAVDRRLAADGYRLVEDPTVADFWVVYHASVVRKVKVSTITTPAIRHDTTRWIYTAPPPVAQTTSTTGMHEYDAGTLMLYVIDPATERPIWRGITEGVVVRDRTEDQRRQRIDQAVDDLLSRFPRR